MREVREGDVVAAEEREGVLHEALRRAVEHPGGLLVHVGGDVVGRHDQDVHAVRARLVVEGAGELVDEGLGGRVRGEEGRGVVARPGADVDDGAGPPVLYGGRVGGLRHGGAVGEVMIGG